MGNRMSGFLIQEIWTAEDEYEALENAGVDSWEGYDEAVSAAEDEGEDWSSLSGGDKLSYLEMFGVDSWEGYEEAIEALKEEEEL